MSSGAPIVTLATDVAIVGAGPNGMALAAHLKALGVDRLVIGRPLSTWRDHMPAGMLLKSEPYASDISAPRPGYRVSDYCRSAGAGYVERSVPLSRERFIDYASWYERELVGDVVCCHVSQLQRIREKFLLHTDDGQRISARRVVVASGPVAFAHIPEVLGSLGPELVTHSSQENDPAKWRGRRVAVVGAGQSAVELAALLNEAGAEPELLARERSLVFNVASEPSRSVWACLRRPTCRLCESWHCWGYYHFPDLFRALPERVRRDKGYNFLGPSAAAWLRPRVEGCLAVSTATRVLGAAPMTSGARLVLGTGGQRREAVYDHIVAATGYRVDISRLGFLVPELCRAVDGRAGPPVLSRSFESKVPNLYFVGCMAAASLGPSNRFLAGTHFMARRLVRSLCHRGRGAG